MPYFDIDEKQCAEMFVIMNKQRIEQDLKIKYLNTDIAASIIYDFIMKNKKNLFVKFVNKSECLHDNDFYLKIIIWLKRAKKNTLQIEMTSEQYIKQLEDKLRKHTFIS